MTSRDPTSPELKDFVRRSVQSVWALELLLLLRTHAEQRWTVEQLATELRASLAVVTGILPQFINDGLVHEVDDSRFTYHPATDELRRKIDALAGMYRESPVALIREITLAPNPKIQSFADAFKFRKD